jgi:hypothetical protein
MIQNSQGTYDEKTIRLLKNFQLIHKQVATCLGIVGSKKGGMEERKLFRYFLKTNYLDFAL